MARDYEHANLVQRSIRLAAGTGPHHKLRKHPDGEIDVEGERWAFHAVEVEDERGERIWQKALETHPGFAAYAKRAAPRRISVFVLHRA
jgi:hypothetical protein